MKAKPIIWPSILVIFSSILVFWVLAHSDENPPDLHPTMEGFALELQGLKPYLAFPEIFESEKAEEVVQQKIRNLRLLAEISAHKRSLKSPEYRPLVQNLITHLNDTEKAFLRGNKGYARYMLQSTTTLCISCHAVMPEVKIKAFNLIPEPKEIPKTFEEAEYYFAIRKTDVALLAFEKLILNHSANNMDVMQLIDALNYTSIIFARMKRDPEGGAKFFEKIVKKKKLPPFIQTDVEAWVKSFEEWEKDGRIDILNTSDKELLAKVRNILRNDLKNPFFFKDNSNQIAYLRASGLLHEFLILKPHSSFRPEAFYLLGICYLTLDHQFDADIENTYLKLCITEYPKSPFTRKCYNLLAESVTLGYSGSSGTHIPEDEKEELKRFQTLLK